MYDIKVRRRLIWKSIGLYEDLFSQAYIDNRGYVVIFNSQEY